MEIHIENEMEAPAHSLFTWLVGTPVPGCHLPAAPACGDPSPGLLLAAFPEALAGSRAIGLEPALGRGMPASEAAA